MHIALPFELICVNKRFRKQMQLNNKEHSVQTTSTFSSTVQAQKDTKDQQGKKRKKGLIEASLQQDTEQNLKLHHFSKIRRVITSQQDQQDQQVESSNNWNKNTVMMKSREKEFNEEARKKVEEMKNKVYSLRTQKLELDRRVSEMESTISSLKDERKVIELTVEEKKNNIQLLTAGMDSDTPQVTALKDIIKMKDAEIEDLKLQLEQQEDTEYHGWDYSELNSDDCTFSEFNDVKDGGFDLKRQYSENETTDFQVEQDTKDNITTSPEEEEQQKLQENEAAMKLGKPDEESSSMTGFGIGSRVRRRHSKRKRKETLQNRRLGDEEQHKFEINQAEKPDSEVINKLNQTTETGNDGQYAKEEGAWKKIGKDQLPLLSNKLSQTRWITFV
ncbi:uncharacterized protein [Spinacia oleracea]|uniref:Shugoshin C-terminal domain-containing protein n=1 Tax=Spinacia oleracea TaxID=3562 RepID=A0ABM3R169_SPIOL|nr:uncharacterized protein LOC130464014 [Spinacia oleracea]